jgi:hypothetical protein
MVVQQKFRKAPEVAASYDWIDLASGTGYINFYAGNVSITTNGETWGEDYVLSNNVFYSHTLSTASGSTASVTYAKVLDLDFDVTINKPITLRGVAIVEVPYDPDGGTGYIKIIIKKNDVEIASESATAATTLITSTTRIDIPETYYVAGDILRMTVEGWCKKTNGNASITLAHDPTGRSADYNQIPNTWNASYSSRLLFQCPIKIVV